MISPNIFRQYPFFSGLSNGQIMVLSELTNEISVEAGHYLFHEGEKLKHLYMLLEGRVELVIGITDHSKEQKFSDLLAGHLITKDIIVGLVDSTELFGWSALIPSFQETTGARAQTPCRVILINCDELLEKFQEDSQFGYLMTQKVTQIAAEHIHELHIESLAFLGGGLNEINRSKLLRNELGGEGGTKTIDQILANKGHSIWSIPPDESVFTAIKLMAEKEIGALLVIDEGKLVGIVSERDYARDIILKGRSSKDTRVRDIMTRNVIHTKLECSVNECLSLMTTNHVRHLPVLEDNQLIGVVSIGDLVKAIISEQRDLIYQLENYILENTSIPLSDIIPWSS